MHNTDTTIQPDSFRHEGSRTIDCFHCGLPVPNNLHLSVSIFAKPQPMCCVGCQAVAQTIIDAGLEDFYQFRTENSSQGLEIIPDFLKELEIYNDLEIQKQFVSGSEDSREAALILEGINCPACIWVNERNLQSLPGVIEVNVNYASRRAQVRWDNNQILLSDILYAIHRIGYAAHPFDPNKQQNLLEQERKTLLRRLGVAGIFGMQVMMLSISLYTGDWTENDLGYQQFFYWVCLLLTLPVILYSARAFFEPAWRDIKNRRVGMDVPVSLGILLAFAGSAWTTVFNGTSDHVYYDSVVMFAFFLLTGRYLELMARKKAVEVTENLVRITPAMTTRLISKAADTDNPDTDNISWFEETVSVAKIAPGDRLLIRAGEHIPVDGVILSGKATIDESILTGESTPLQKIAGMTVIGGSINIESPIQIEVEKIGQDTVLSQILRILERAQSERPTVVGISDLVAKWFVTCVLIIASLVAIYWFSTGNERWFQITLSVLVVSCPCALSLAMPAAITTATGTLMRSGILSTRGHALETLARSTHVIFDKTGTLTYGRLKLVETRCFTRESETDCLKIATALEAQSEHPIAKALIEANENSNEENSATDIINMPGQGIEGNVDNKHYFIGTSAFIQDKNGNALEHENSHDLHKQGHTVILLADRENILCAFLLVDAIRDGAAQVVAALKDAGKEVILMTGDNQQSAELIGHALGINHIYAALKPEDKLARVHELQDHGAIIAMVGDGINDAPVLAGAQVSIAMSTGTELARASADLIFMNEKFQNLLMAFKISDKTSAIIRQNILWAIAYNVLALPAAMMGYIPPWLAAIGMSLSSLLVVSNALRINNQKLKI
jgi:P-type Cu2+ transporter